MSACTIRTSLIQTAIRSSTGEGGYPTAVISIAMLAIRPAELEAILQDNVHYEDAG